MSDRTTALDRLSLTLPDWRTALKKRIRRPRRPNRHRVWAIFWMLLALLDLLPPPSWVFFGGSLVIACSRWAMSYRPEVEHRPYSRAMDAVTVVWIVYLVVQALR